MKWMPFLAALALGGCADREAERQRERVIAERVAQDSASRAWRHTVGVDSLRMRGDTAVVWVSPRNWAATDAPQAGVSVAPGGRIIHVRWILGG